VEINLSGKEWGKSGTAIHLPFVPKGTATISDPLRYVLEEVSDPTPAVFLFESWPDLTPSRVGSGGVCNGQDKLRSDQNGRRVYKNGGRSAEKRLWGSPARQHYRSAAAASGVP
jgi:hypothetical protein